MTSPTPDPSPPVAADPSSIPKPRNPVPSWESDDAPTSIDQTEPKVRQRPRHASTLRVRAAAAIRRLDFLSMDRPVSGRFELAMLILLPLATFGVVCIATNAENVAFQAHCNSVSNFVASLLFQQTKPSTCQAIPFLSDIPTVILSFTSPFALVGYRLLRRRLEWMLSAVTATGLLKPQDANSRLLPAIQRIKKSVDMTVLGRLTLFIVCCAMTTWLYWRNLVAGHLFSTLQTVYPNGKTNAAELRASWWANYHYHPWLAVLCVFIGSVGVYYAMRSGWLYIRLGIFLFRTRKADPEVLPLDYVPQWKDRSYGWGPVTGALTLIYFSTVNFAMSMASVYDMLRNERWTLFIATFFVLLGLISNLAIILTSFSRILAAHQAVSDRLRIRLGATLKDMRLDVSIAAWCTIAAADLSSWRRVPISSVTGGVIKILPGVYALFQLIRALSGMKP